MLQLIRRSPLKQKPGTKRFIKERVSKNQYSPLFSKNPAHRELLDKILRVDHAGELGAIRIYEGQLAILDKSEYGPVIHEMYEQEQYHLSTMARLLHERRVRPSALSPLWNVGAFALGAGSAILGKEAAMACTEAVEDVISEHYNGQLRELVEKCPEDQELRDIIKQFRDDEQHHQNTAIEHHSRDAPMYTALYPTFKAITKAAVWVATRV